MAHWSGPPVPQGIAAELHVGAREGSWMQDSEAGDIVGDDKSARRCQGRRLGVTGLDDQPQV
jgi:hypothetical protein